MIVDGKSDFHLQKKDIWVESGKIKKIGDNLDEQEGAVVVDGEGLHVSQGWIDMSVWTGQPGLEHRDTLTTTAESSVQGGYTTICIMPDLNPPLHSQTEIQYIKYQSASLPVHMLPIGAVSRGLEGKDMAELFDMHHSGAVAFSEGQKGIQDGGLMLRTLQYSKTFEGLIFQQPRDKHLSQGGQMHEGYTSTSLGLKGLPSIAEEIILKRDLDLIRYTGGRVHFSNISTKGSVEIIRLAKKEGLPVTASVSLVNLCFTDEDLSEFDNNLKVYPPLRSVSDKDALVEGLLDGTIDAILCNHLPLDEEHKNLEFTYADFGAAILESAFGLLWKHVRETISLEQLVEILTRKPRQILGLPSSTIAEGEPAELTLFNPDKAWTFGSGDIYSLSGNYPALGRELLGKPVGILNKKQYYPSKS